MALLIARSLAWLALASAMLVPSHAAAQATEASVKAALVYKFASYVEWPPEAFTAPDAPFVIAITGADDVAAEVEALVKGRKVNTHPILVRRLKEGDPLNGVHLLFAGRAASARLPAIAKVARPLSVLVVSDAERGLEAGSVINIVRIEDRLGFEVSMEAASESALKISSRMLALARRVMARSS